MIKSLDEATITRLCSSQVVISLASAVKELVENAMDAEATSISVKFFDLGASSVEVADNGFGIERANLDLLAYKHATSKLTTFDDLSQLISFGFRGEALSSIAHLAKLSVITRHRNSEMGYKAEYDSDGSLSSIEPTARPVGTTILMKELFYSYPVRRKLLTDPKTCTKEFNSALEFILPYCLISTKAQISIYKVVKNALKLLHTNSSTSGLNYEKNLQNIYGSKIIETLLYFNSKDVKFDSTDLTVEGYISKPIVEQSETSLYGRSSADRQFIFINNRPCHFKLFVKVITDLWRRVGQESLDESTSGIKMPVRSCFGANKHPLIFLVINCPSDFVDVNLTPDKRTLYIKKEKEICQYIQKIISNYLKAYTQKSLKSHDVNVEQTKISDTSFGFTVNQEIVVKSRPSRTFEISKPVKRDQSLLIENIKDEDHDCTNDLSAKRSKAEIDFKDFSLNENGISQVTDVKYVEFGDFSSILELEKEKSRNHSGFHTGQFYASSINQDNSKSCQVEDELQRLIKCEDFLNMEIIGQFNKGFIITQLKDDMFIVDQHASDEKSRFESLMKNYKPKRQPLACELNLDLTMEQEDILIENMEIFEENGFQFSWEDGEKIRLKAVPICDNKVFDKADIEEMLHIIKETRTSYCRPSKLRDKFASMACRGAVMIGDDLNNHQMKRILKNLSELVHPWNCPHGRPTMRHLFHLRKI